MHAGRIGGAQAGTQIVRVGDPVEQQQQRILDFDLTLPANPAPSSGLSGRTAATAP